MDLQRAQCPGSRLGGAALPGRAQRVARATAPGGWSSAGLWRRLRLWDESRCSGHLLSRRASRRCRAVAHLQVGEQRLGSALGNRATKGAASDAGLGRQGPAQPQPKQPPTRPTVAARSPAPWPQPRTSRPVYRTPFHRCPPRTRRQQEARSRWPRGQGPWGTGRAHLTEQRRFRFCTLAAPAVFPGAGVHRPRRHTLPAAPGSLPNPNQPAPRPSPVAPPVGSIGPRAGSAPPSTAAPEAAYAPPEAADPSLPAPG